MENWKLDFILLAGKELLKTRMPTEALRVELRDAIDDLLAWHPQVRYAEGKIGEPPFDFVPRKRVPDKPFDSARWECSRFCDGLDEIWYQCSKENQREDILRGDVTDSR
jgi:hypothetical protein